MQKLPPQIIEEFIYLGKISYNNIEIQHKNSINVLALREGAQVEEGTDPRKILDEIIYEPLNLEEVHFRPETVTKSKELLKKIKFEPEFLQNLRELDFQYDKLMMKTNLTNYGSMAVIRRLVPYLSLEELLDVENQISAVGMAATIISPKSGSIYFGQRGKTEVGGTWMPYPAGTWKGGTRFYDLILEEFEEEAGLGLENTYITGVGRGVTQSCNPAVYLVKEEEITLKELWKRTDKINPLIGSREHDSILATVLDETPFENYITDHMISIRPKTREAYYRLVDNGTLGAIQAARSYGFSDKWYNRFKGLLRDLGVTIYERNPFAPK